MNYQIVSRVVFGVSALFLGVALLFAHLKTQIIPEANAAPPADPGAALFAQHCASCHTVADLAPTVRAEPEEELQFLKKHGKASDAEDQAIVAYLLKLP